jgi:hypothetical protein
MSIAPSYEAAKELESEQASRNDTLDMASASDPRSAGSIGEINLGFMTVVHEASGYVGGYLVTNTWGRPLEFRLSTAVQPNRIQQILYGGGLQPYVFADLIGKALFDRTTTPVQLLLTDRRPLLELRRRIEVPMTWLSVEGEREPEGTGLTASIDRTVDRGPNWHCHADFSDDKQRFVEIMSRLAGGIDWQEPFARVREAINEARKMGATARV